MEESGDVEEMKVESEVELATSAKTGNGADKTAAWRGKEGTVGITR